MWTKRFRTLVRKVRQVRQNSPLRTRKNIFTKMTFRKKIFNVIFSDFQHFIFRLFPIFETGFQNCALPIRKNFWIKIAYFLGKLLGKNFWALFWKKLRKHFYRSSAKFFRHGCQKCNLPVHWKNWGKFFLVEKYVI